MDEQYIQQETISIEEIEKEKNEEKQKNVIEFTLSVSKIAVKMDFQKATGRLLMEIRQQDEAIHQPTTLAARVFIEICTFNDKKYTLDEILDLPLDDVLELEVVYRTRKKPE